MLDIFGTIASLERPRLLVETARRGAHGYRRARHLRRILGAVPRPGEAILQLLEIEVALEAQRREAQELYLPSRHVEVLIALLGERQHLRDTRPVLVAA